MQKKTIDVRIPPDWMEVPESGGRMWRKKESPVGILRLAVYPPQWDEIPPREMMEGLLLKLVNALDLSLGELQTIVCDDFVIGPAGICLYRTPGVGLMAFCLIAAEVALFATFQQDGGTDDEYEEQLAEALAILQKSAMIESGQPTDGL